MLHFVLVPPANVNIRGVKGLRVSSLVGPYALGDTLNLWCTASGGQFYNSSCLIWRLPNSAYILINNSELMCNDSMNLYS